MHASEAIVIVVAVVVVLLPWLTIRDVLRHPPSSYRDIGQRRWFWLVAIVAVPVIGVALYIRLARPRLRTPVRPH